MSESEIDSAVDKMIDEAIAGELTANGLSFDYAREIVDYCVIADGGTRNQNSLTDKKDRSDDVGYA